MLSLLLTLLATPVAYSLFDDAAGEDAAHVPASASVPDSETGADEIMGPPPVAAEGTGTIVLRASRRLSEPRKSLRRWPSCWRWLRGHAAAPRADGARRERELTLDDALALAKKRNKSLAAERARLEQAQTNVSSAWARLLPTIAAQGKYTRNNTEFASAACPDGMTRPGGHLLIQPVNQLDARRSASPRRCSCRPPTRAAGGQGGRRRRRGELRAVGDDVLFARRADLLRRRDRRRGAGGAPVQHRRRPRHPRERQDAAVGGTVTKVDVDRAELALLRAEQIGARGARTAREQTYRALGTLIQLEGPFRVKAPARRRASPPPPQRSRTWRCSCGPSSARWSCRRRPPIAGERPTRWRWSPQLSAFGNARRFNYDNFARDRYSWAVGRAARLGHLRRRRARRAAPPGRRAGSGEPGARRGAARQHPRRSGRPARSLVDTKLQAVRPPTRSVELARETMELVRMQYEAGTVDAGGSAAGAGRPGRRAGGAGPGPLRRGGRRPGAAQGRRHLPAPLNGR